MSIEGPRPAEQPATQAPPERFVGRARVGDGAIPRAQAPQQGATGPSETYIAPQGSFGQSGGVWEGTIRPLLSPIVTTAEKIAKAVTEKPTPEGEEPTGLDRPLGERHDAALNTPDPDQADVDAYRQTVQEVDDAAFKIRVGADSSEDPAPFLPLRDPLPVPRDQIDPRIHIEGDSTY